MSEPQEKKLKILIIDDDQDTCRLAKYILELDGRYKVLIATGGGIGAWIASCRWHKPSLILLDIKMPGMDGFQVLEKIRAHPRTKYIPVIIYTAFDDPAFKIKVEGFYCDGWVLKTESTEVLKGKIEEVLKNRGLL
jgi:two-component system alkaline phosphatase synthesis response regulator PhoP